MKNNIDWRSALKPVPQQIISILVLTGILCLGSSLILLDPAIAIPKINSALEVVQHPKQLPRSVADAVLQDLSRKLKKNPAKLKITAYSRETWSDGCLGLSQPDQLCTQALVEGWRVILSDGCQTWVYRTDGEGQVLRLED